MRTRFLLLLSILNLTAQAQFGPKWGDQGDQTYNNPILPADYSDLDAIRVGSDFYAISSTFQYSPGVVVLHSRDLVNWEIAGHVVSDLNQISPEMNWDRMNRYGNGIWAGSIRYYKNRFWVYFGTPDEGFFMSSAEKVEGPWEPLHCVMPAKGWDDCCSFLDDDGQLYFIATNFALDPATGKKYNIHLFKMTPDGKQLIPGSDTIIYCSNGSEANKLYKIDGLYYHYFSEVHREGRVIMMERAKSLKGPWEVRQLNHVDQRVDREPNQGGLIQLEDGKWQFLTHHGTGGSFEGRVASLLPVTWMNGWPVVGKPGRDSIGTMVWQAAMPLKPDPSLRIQTDDAFDGPNLALQWEWNYQPRADKWSLNECKGFLRLYAFRPIHPEKPDKIILRAGNTLTQRSMRTLANEATVRLDLHGMADGQSTGLTHFSTAFYSLFGIRQLHGKRRLFCEINGKDSLGMEVHKRIIYLKSTWDLEGIGRYFYSFDNKTFLALGETHRYNWGSYRGDRIGLFSFNILEDKGFVDVDWVRYRYSK